MEKSIAGRVQRLEAGAPEASGSDGHVVARCPVIDPPGLLKKEGQRIFRRGMV